MKGHGTLNAALAGLVFGIGVFYPPQESSPQPGSSEPQNLSGGSPSVERSMSGRAVPLFPSSDHIILSGGSGIQAAGLEYMKRSDAERMHANALVDRLFQSQNGLYSGQLDDATLRLMTD